MASLSNHIIYVLASSLRVDREILPHPLIFSLVAAAHRREHGAGARAFAAADAFFVINRRRGKPFLRNRARRADRNRRTRMILRAKLRTNNNHNEPPS